MKQQGDIIFVRVEKIPKSIKIIGNVLAEGEATGHAHRIESEDFQVYEKDGNLYLHLEKEGTVTHEEHKPITLEPGDWEIGRILEYDYLNEAIERVRD